MTALEILRAARRLLTPEGAWTRGAMARDKDGRPVSHTDRKAVCWSIYGALLCVAPVIANRERYLACAALHEQMPARLRALSMFSDAFPIFNEDPHTTHADVLALFDRAIATEEAKP